MPRKTSELPPLSELRSKYVDRCRPLPRAIEAQLEADPRQGATAILDAVRRRRKKNRAEGQRLRHILRYEESIWGTGVERIAGVDEAGMSPLAGPVTAAAVILPIRCRVIGVDDSKKLSAEKREELAVEIKERAIAWGVGMVEPEEIDEINIYRAGLLAMRRAVEALTPEPEHLLIDARALPELPLPQKSIIKGDAESASIAAASIIAKTTRDALMVEMDRKFPGYGFAQHKGYPVKQHYEALETLGVLPIHRRSFAPVRKALGELPEQQDLFS
ncbi:MAG: ribonuclease HII [Myxococcota bacterium]